MIYDVAIIGAGHNGLITASYLAQAGKNVVIIEQNHMENLQYQSIKLTSLF